MAYRVHCSMPMAKRGGRGSGRKQQVVDITPIILVEIRDGVRELSTCMDRVAQRMDGLEQRMDGLEREMVTLRQDTHEEINKLRVVMERRFDLLERRVGALESAVFHRQ